ncbi:hypothetical protein FQA39_LY12880 [Lamprigera yunnana]|nr:hypothetical protein FQA39_LY12880 [Lamprigera yunnana]
MIPINHVDPIQMNQDIKGDGLGLSELPAPNSENIIEYINNVAIAYVHVQVMPKSVSVNIDRIGVGTLTNEKLLKSARYLIHHEVDTLTNNTEQMQTLKSSGFSRKYSNTLTHTMIKSFGADVSIPLMLRTFKFAANINDTRIQTQTVETTLSSPEQAVFVPPHSSREVVYDVYENDKVYDYVIKTEIP